MSWNQIQDACANAGKRLPTLAEWQTAYSGYDGALWPWGSDEYDPEAAESCYINNTNPPLPYLAYPTGGCCFENCQGGPCFTVCDMLGNVSEFVDGYWDESCYGEDQILIAGGSLGGWQDPNRQTPVLLSASTRGVVYIWRGLILSTHTLVDTGCWYWLFISQTRFSLHHHHPWDGWFYDDGFRCAKSVEEDADAAGESMAVGGRVTR